MIQAMLLIAFGFLVGNKLRKINFIAARITFICSLAIMILTFIILGMSESITSGILFFFSIGIFGGVLYRNNFRNPPPAK